MILRTLFPVVADNRVRGSRIPLYVFTLIALVSTIRSCIHLLAPDGGAGSIAGIDLSVPWAEGIIFAFALWIQLLVDGKLCHASPRHVDAGLVVIAP